MGTRNAPTRQELQQTAAARARKKVKKNVAEGIAHIHASFNNTIVTITDRQGYTLAWATSGVAGGRPGKRVALAIRDRHDGVVERGVDMRDPLSHVLLDLLARAGCRGLLQLLAGRCVSASHVLGGLPCWYVEFDRGLARTLARARVGARTLTAHRQALAVARAAIAVKVDQAFDRHLHLAAQIALDREARHALADAIELGVGQLLDLARSLHASRGANRLRAGAADAEDRRQRDLGVLVVWNVYPCNAGHIDV